MNTEAKDDAFNILLIEDNPADIPTIHEILKEFKTKTTLDTVNSGVEALEPYMFVVSKS